MPTEKPLDIEALKKRHKELEHQKVTSEANFKTATEQLEAVKKEALDKYGTDEIDQLRNKLLEMKDQNERTRAQYQKHLEEIETRLAQVETNFANPPTP